MRRFVLICAALTAGNATAAEPNEPPPVPPPLPEGEVPPADGEQLQPEVTIIQRGEDVIEEYRVGGQLYMVKITPAKGAPYYLIDTDGDGSLETHRNDLANPPINQWRVLTW